MKTTSKSALITGASQRIGAAIARDLAAHGFNVAVHYSSSAEKARNLVQELSENGGKHVAVQADLTDSGQTNDLFGTVVAELGTIELLVNNASIFEKDRASVFNGEAWDRHFAIHTRAPSMLAAQFCAQQGMDDGLIVNIVDQRVAKPNPTYYSYTLSKSTLWMATKTMAQEYAPRVRVNAIGPGPTLPNARQSESDFQKQVAALPLECAPQLAEFGQAIRFLYNTPSITGQILMLDGGQHLAWQTPDLDAEE